MEGNTSIQDAQAEIKELLSKWRGVPCIVVEFDIAGDTLVVRAKFARLLGKE